MSKLTSRKLWIAIAGISVGIALALGADSSDIQTVCGSITTVISTVTYILAETSLDKKTE